MYIPIPFVQLCILPPPSTDISNRKRFIMIVPNVILLVLLEVS